MPTINVIEFVRQKQGKRETLLMETTEEVAYLATLIEKEGLEITMEKTGFQVFFSILDPRRGDHLIENTRTGPRMVKELENLIRSFSSHTYRLWAADWDATEKARTKPRASREALRTVDQEKRR